MNPKFNYAGRLAPASLSSRQISNTGPQGSAAELTIPDEILPLRLKTVAQMTEVSEKTVRRWIQRGLLFSYKLCGSRVVSKRDLRTFLDQQAGAVNKQVRQGPTSLGGDHVPTRV